jgi:uncharacterized membrane protein
MTFEDMHLEAAQRESGSESTRCSRLLSTVGIVLISIALRKVDRHRAAQIKNQVHRINILGTFITMVVVALLEGLPIQVIRTPL